MTRLVAHRAFVAGLAVAGTLTTTPAAAQSAVARHYAVSFDGAEESGGTHLQGTWQLGSASTLFAAEPAGQGSAAAQTSATPPPPPFEYSDAYRMRAKIHKIASFATLPLFATQLFLGQSLYNDSTEGKRSAHAAVGASIGVLFGVNTVTGVWNLIEARKDPDGRGRRILHGLLMLAADAGFVATAAWAPSEDDDRENGTFTTNGDRGVHRNLAIASISTATVGYLIMLFGGH